CPGAGYCCCQRGLFTRSQRVQPGVKLCWDFDCCEFAHHGPKHPIGMTYTPSPLRPAAPVLVLTPSAAGSPWRSLSTLEANRSSAEAASSISCGLSLTSNAAHLLSRVETTAWTSLPLESR